MGFRGLCFPGQFPIPRFYEDEVHEDKFTTPFAPFSKGDLFIAYAM